VTYETQASGWSSGKMAAVAVLIIIAVLAAVAGVMYLTEPAKSLPSFLGAITHPASRAAAHRSTRGIVAIAVAVVGLVAAWFVSRRR
jgi:amino acid permease